MPSLLDPLLIPARDDFDLLQAKDPDLAAATVHASRIAARRSYACFLRYWMFATRAPFQWNWHWAYLADIMQAVADREPEVRFLIVNIPPRFAKSTLLSQMWQAWMIGREDNRRSSLFSTSCTASLAARDSRRTLEMVKSPWYHTLFPDVAVGDKKETENEWETNGGAYRIACGAGGTVTGRGADHLLWDDLIQADDANSETIREKANEWMGETFRSRLDDQKTGTITGIMQRLHERDATGYLLEQMRKPGADKYHHIIIPHEAIGRTVVQFKNTVYAVREDKELLHAERIGPTEAAAIRVSQRHNYDGQYQQNPTKMTGGHLDPRRLVRIKGGALEVKSAFGIRAHFFLDFAATEKQTQKDHPDFTAIGVYGRDQLGRLVILDIWRRQTADYGLIARTLINMHKLWQPWTVKGEKGALINIFQPVLNQQSILLGHFVNLVPLPNRGNQDKVARSMAFQGMLNAGMVAVPEDAPWLPGFEAEARSFPNGANDDQLDTAFDAAIEYHNMQKGDAPPTHPTEPDAVLDQEYKDRIAAAVARANSPPVDQNDWKW
jgi:predicted phage terminase large subunit-like protein